MKRTETTSIEPTGQDVGSCKITSIEPDNQGGIGCGIISIEPELRKAITGSITMRLQNLQEELKKDPKNNQIREQIAEIRRELNRTKQYSNITQENSKKLIGSKNIDTASAATLIKIDREEWGRGEFLSRSFLYKQTKDSGGNIYEEPSNGKDLREWDTLLVDFGKNKNAYNLIGLGHMLTADIGYIKVNWKIGIRSIINNRVGYYTQANPSWYIPIFTWDIVTLPTTSEIGTFEKQKDSSLRRNSNQNESNKANDTYIQRMEWMIKSPSIELNTYIKESYDFWLQKWFTPEQASWIVANEYRESWGNPKASNANAVGIFQWKSDRREAIRKWSGINIDQASHIDQLNAAYWEMTQGAESAVLQPIRNAKTAREAAAIFSEKYERPGNRQNEMDIRGNLAEAFYFQVKWGTMEWPANQRIESVAMNAKRQGDIMWAEHCTDWVDRVYLKAVWKRVYDVNTYFDGIATIARWTWYGGTYAPENAIKNINTGMHIIVDKPPYQNWQTHSVIALWKVNDWLVTVVSYPNKKIPPRVEVYDLLARGRWDKDWRVLRIQWV